MKAIAILLIVCITGIGMMGVKRAENTKSSLEPRVEALEKIVKQLNKSEDFDNEAGLDENGIIIRPPERKQAVNPLNVILRDLENQRKVK